MVFQNITFKHTNSNTDNRIDALVAQKLSSLEKYIGDESDVKCEVEFEKISNQKSGKVCRTEVNIWVAGTLYRADALGDTFEASVDLVKDELDQEMKKAHKKRNSMLRKGGRMIKEMMRFGRSE